MTRSRYNHPFSSLDIIHMECRVLEAGKNGIDTYIAFPTAIYGVAEGFVKLFGVLHDFCIATSRKLGFVPYIGAGTNTINSVSFPQSWPPGGALLTVCRFTSWTLPHS